jgi:major membrane immunogen (membrane-anchored lipoprotein)
MNITMNRTITALLVTSSMLLAACNSSSSSSDSENDNNNSGNDQNSGGQTTVDQLREITDENKLVIAQYVYRRMYWNDLGSWGTTTDERDAYQLAYLAKLHDEYTTQTPDAAVAGGDSLASLCASSGDVVRSTTEDGGFLFTYQDCRWTTYFGNNRRMDGTVSLEPYTTGYDQGWIVGMFFDYGTGAQYRGELTFEYTSDTNYRISNLNVTVETEFGETRYDDVELERSPVGAFFSGDLYFQDEYTNDEDNGTLTASTSGLNRLDGPNDGTLIIEGADGNTLTIDFKASGVDIQFNDEAPESYSDSAFDPRA